MKILALDLVIIGWLIISGASGDRWWTGNDWLGVWICVFSSGDGKWGEGKGESNAAKYWDRESSSWIAGYVKEKVKEELIGHDYNDDQEFKDEK